MMAVRGLCVILFMGMYCSTIRGGDEDENHSVEIARSDKIADQTRCSLLILYDLFWVPCSIV